MWIERGFTIALTVLSMAALVLLLISCTATPIPTGESPSQTTAPHSQMFPPPSQVDETDDYRGLGYTDQRKIARDSNGNLYLAYRKKYPTGQSACYHIFVSKSSDNGASWTVLNQNAPIERTGDCAQRVPTIAVDDRDVIHVAWYGKDPDNTGDNQRQIKYARSTDGGATWSDWINVAKVPGYRGQPLWQEHPVLYVGARDTIYIVWQGLDSTYSSASQAKFVKSADGGATWDAWKNVSPMSRRNQSRPTIVTTNDGNRLYILAYGGVDGVQQIIWTTSADRGDTWTPWSAVAPSAGDQRHVSVVLDSSDHLHAVWREVDGSGTTQIEYCTYNGKSWSAATSVGAYPAMYQFFPSIAVTSKDTLWVVWTESASPSDYPEDNPTDGQIWYVSKPAGGAWSRRIMLTPQSGASIYASLRWGHYNNGGNIDVIWLDSHDGSSSQIRHAALGAW
jgi:hypothetical protein